MTYVVDTNVWIGYLRKRGSANLLAKIRAIDPTEIAICTVVRAELITGAYKSRATATGLQEIYDLCSLFESLPFDVAAADIYGRERAELERAGQPIGGNDLMIAAIALANNCILVTHNTREFSRVPGLRLEDWQ